MGEVPPNVTPEATSKPQPKSKGKAQRQPKRKRRLSAAEKLRRKRYMTIFVRGKQKRVLRPEHVDGLDAHEFIRRNADDIWLIQEGEYWLLEQDRKPS